MVEQDSNEASTKYKEAHYKSASKHNLEICDKVLIDNHLPGAKNKNISLMWIGLFVNSKTINEENVELKIKNRSQI